MVTGGLMALAIGIRLLLSSHRAGRTPRLTKAQWKPDGVNIAFMVTIQSSFIRIHGEHCNRISPQGCSVSAGVSLFTLRPYDRAHALFIISMYALTSLLYTKRLRFCGIALRI